MNNDLNNYGTVDERIVEMRIDNAQFENGAKKTISLLEKLDKALHLHAETDEIDKLTDAVGKFDVSPMANGLDSLQRHFSALEIAGMRVISNLTDSVYNFTARTIKNLSVDQVTAGWSKYEQKTSAVQTIMAATRKDIGTLYADEAEQMEAVNAQLEKLNWFTDETSYSFLDMVNNIGKFTSNGRALDESVTAMMGISTWAAISGAKVQEASRAMYNLSQALGTGSVQVRDWMSIENANMATYEFKQMAIETAEALGTLKKRSDGVWESLKGNEVTVESFRENLKDDWFTSDVLLETLQNYGSFTEALKIATEKTHTKATEFLRAMRRFEEGEEVDEDLIPWIKELSKAQYELGRRAFQAAQEAKTFTEAIDATKDAVSTGWMNSFEKIFGDYQTAKTFWTDIANDLWEIFAGGGESRNSMLDVAFGKVTDAIDDNETVKEAKNAWSEFEEQLNDAGLSMDDFRASYEKVIEASDDDALKRLVDEGNSIEDVFRRGAISGKTFKDILDDLTGKAKETAKTTGNIDLSSNMDTKLDEYRALIPKIMRGDFGNGEERKAAIEALGYNYEIAQRLAEWSYLGYSTELEQLAQEFPTLVEMMRDEMVANGTITEEELIRVNLLLNDTDATLAKLQNATGTMTDKTVAGTQRAIDRGELFRKGLVNILDTVVLVKNIVNEAFKTVFGTAKERGEVLGQLIERFYDITEYVKESNNKASDTRKGLVRIFEVIFRIAHLVTRVIGLGFKLVNQVIGVSYRFVEKILAAIGRTRKETEEIGKASIFDILESTLDTIEAISLLVTSILHSILDSNMTQSIFSALTSGLIKISDWLGIAKGYAKSVIDFLEPAVGLLLMALAGITSFAASHVFTAITAVFKAITSLPSSIVNFVSSSQLLSSIWSGISTIIDKIKKNLQKGWEFVRGIFENRGFTEALKGLRTWASDMLGKVFPNLVGAFENFNIKFTGEGNIFQSILTGITSGLTGIGGLFVVVFGGLLNLITGLVKGLQGVNFNTDKIAEGFNDFYEIVKLIFNGLFGDATEFKERIANFVTNAWEGFKESMEQISIRDALKALRLSFVFMIGTKILSVLSMVKKIGEEAASIPESITGAIKSGGRVLDSIAKSFQANAIIKMAVATTIVAMALYGLSKIPEDKLTHAAAIISVVMIIMTLLAKAFNSTTRFQSVNIKKFSVFGELGSALLGLGIAIAAFARAVFKIGNMEHPERLIPAVGSIIAFIGSIILLAGIFAAYFTKSTMNWERLKAVGMIMGKLGWSIMLLSLSIGNLIAPVFAFTAAAALLEKYNLSTWNLWGSIIGVSALILTLAIGLRMLIGAFGKIKDAEAIKRTGGSILKMGAGILLISIAISGIIVPILVLTAVFAKLNSMPNATTGVLWQAFGMVAGILGSFLIFFATLALITRKMNGSQLQHLGGSMLKMGASILLISFALNSVVFSLLEIIAVFALFEKKGWAFDYKKALIIIGSIAGGLLAFAAVLGAISLMPFKSTKLLAMAAVFMALGMAMLFVTPLILLFTAAVAAILYYTKDIVDFGAAITRMGKIAGILIMIGVAALAFGAGISFLGTGVLKAAAAILLLSVSINIIVKAIEALVTHQDDLSAFWKKLNNWLTIDTIWKLTKISIIIAGLVILMLALTKRIKDFAIAWKLLATGETLNTKLGNIFTSLGSQFPKLFKKVGNYLITHKTQVMEALIWMIGIIGGYISGLIPTMVEQLMNAITELLNSLKTSLQRNRSVLVDSIAGIANIIIDIFAEVLKKTFSSLFSGEEWARNPIANAIKAGFGSISAIKLASALINLIFAGSRLGTLFKGAGAATAKGGASSAVQAAAQVATNAAGAGGTVNLAQNSINGIGEAVSTAVGDTVGEAMSGTAESLLSKFLGPILIIGVIAAGIWATVHGVKTIAENSKRQQEEIKDTVDKLLEQNPTPEDHQKVIVENLDTIRDAKRPMTAFEQKQLAPEDRVQTGSSQFAFDSYTRTAIANIRKAESVSEAFLQTMAEDLGGFLSISDTRKLIKKYSSADTESNIDAIKADITKYYESYVQSFTTELREGFHIDEAMTQYLLSRLEDLRKYYDSSNINEILGYFEQINTRIPFKDFISKIQGTELDLLDALTLVDLLPDRTFLDTSITKLIDYSNKLKQSDVSVDELNDFSYNFGLSIADLGDLMDATNLSMSSIINLAKIFQDNFSDISPTDLVSAYNTIIQSGRSFDEVNTILRKYGITFSDITQKMSETGISFGDMIWLLDEYGRTTIFSNNSAQELNKLLENLRKRKAEADRKAEEEKRQIEEAKRLKEEEIAKFKDSTQYISSEVSSALSEGDYKGAAKAFASSFIPNIIDGDALVAEIDQALAGHPEVADILNKNIAASGLGNNISEAVNNAVKNGIDTAKISEVISNSLAEAQKDPKIASEMSNFISNFMPLDSDKTLLADSYGSLAKDAMGGYVNTLLGSLLPVYGANAQIAKTGQNAIMDTNDSHSPSRVYMGFGKNAVDGLIIGIRNNLQAAYNAGVALANAVNEGYRRTLKINSPSKVFEAMSRYIPEGVAIGINNNQEPAITAIVGLGKAVIEAAHRTMAQVSYVASDDFNFQPSITPVVDFGEIRAGASNLSSIFSRNATDVNVRPHGRYSDVNMPETAMSYTMTNQNKDVVNEIHRLSDLMSQLGEEITSMKIVLNSGVLVGEMAPQINNRLGVLAQRERRQ